MQNNNSEDAKKLEALEQLGKDNHVKNPISPIDGWIDIKKDDISYNARLYPASYRFQVKPVTAGTAKYFAALDETDALSVNDALTYVIDNHVRILDGNRKLPTVDTLYEHDRFKFVMLVHLYSGAPTTLSYTGSCTHNKCRREQAIDITHDKLQYSQLSDKALSWLNETTGYFVIPTKTMGVRHYRPLSLAEASESVMFIESQKRKGLQIEALFTKLAGFFMHDKTMGETIESIYKRYLHATQDLKEVSLLQEIADNINVGQTFDITTDCKGCKNPFNSKITSVAGIRNIFLVHDISGEL
jgi:hypothetical protein